MEKNFVVFYSPGTFVPEETEKEISSWDVDLASEMAESIQERHGATPFGFRFLTKTREGDEWNVKITKNSGIYYLGGVVKTLEDIEKENKKENEILLSNMKVNGYKRVIVNENSYRFTAVLNDDDVVLDWAPRMGHKM